MMRMSKPLFLLMALAIGPAFAADGGVASRVIPGNLNNNTSEDTAARATTRTTVSRGKATADSTKDTSRGSGATSSRTTASRTTVSRSDTSGSRSTVSRATDLTKSTASRSTVGDINDNPVVRRAGVVLRPSFADYGGRATISGTNQQTGSNIKTDIQKVANRSAIAKAIVPTKESIDDTREKLELTAELNVSCQEQYNECMDQFCAIVDANQKRCSCSSNLSKYAKVEEAVTEANAKLNEVAQAIRYVGLSADEIRAIMTETEAEAALNSTTDTSTTRQWLKDIEGMIKDPTTATKTTTYSSGWDWNMDWSFDDFLEQLSSMTSITTDMFSLDFTSSNTNNSISNTRGDKLYSIAKNRCKTILTQCKDAGATQDQITGNYDLAIDKDCIAYEAGLKKMNETLLSNVKSANLMLQKARYAAMANKNEYDARGCVSALENCMKDDMVCGEDYLKCVDPTKAYIDENGEVVLGQDITVIQSFMTNYNNAAINASFLSTAYGTGTEISAESCRGDNGDGRCVVKYLMQKIGTKQKATDEGLCRAVLDKCQVYTYKDGVYNMTNDIVVNYVQRAMVNIRAAQQKIISDYASSCIIDVATCYNQQVSQVTSWATAANASNIYSVMRGACRSVALTCGLAIFSGEPKIKENQDLVIGGTTYNVSGCNIIPESSEVGYNDGIINCVSNMFYQSLLCPDNSTYVTGEGTVGVNGFVNSKCKCNAGYEVYGTDCVKKCANNQKRVNGSCQCIKSTYNIYRNGGCYRKTDNGYELDPDQTDETTDSGSESGPTTPTTYSVTYDRNGGSCGKTSENVVSGSSVTMPNCSNGNQTLTWSCNGTSVTAGGTYRVTRDTTCIAQWSGTPMSMAQTIQNALETDYSMSSSIYHNENPILLKVDDFCLKFDSDGKFDAIVSCD